MKLFLRDVALVVAVLVALALVFAAIGRTLPLSSYLAGGSVGIVAAAARTLRRRLEAQERDRNYRNR